MKSLLALAILVLMAVASLAAEPAPDAPQLTTLLKEFLAGAATDAAVHDRFWAEDLIYTGSSGRRIGKADIMRDMRAAPARKEGDPTVSYSAEDIRIQQYGDTAVVAFRLVGVERGARTRVSSYLNSGTFLRRDGKWQAVNWQATRMLRAEEESKKEVAALESDFHAALTAGDAKALESIVAEGFIWARSNGERITRQHLLDQVRAGSLKNGKSETSDVRVSVFGDTAVVQGIASAPKSAEEREKARQFPYTLTFTNTAGGWRAVALNTNTP